MWKQQCKSGVCSITIHACSWQLGEGTVPLSSRWCNNIQFSEYYGKVNSSFWSYLCEMWMWCHFLYMTPGPASIYNSLVYLWKAPFPILWQCVMATCSHMVARPVFFCDKFPMRISLHLCNPLKIWQWRFPPHLFPSMADRQNSWWSLSLVCPYMSSRAENMEQTRGQRRKAIVYLPNQFNSTLCVAVWSGLVCCFCHAQNRCIECSAGTHTQCSLVQLIGIPQKHWLGKV